MKFHILSGDYCPYCKMAMGAMMFYFKARNNAELRGRVKLYEVGEDEDQFDNKFDHLIPSTWKTIPIIIEEKANKFRFVGGLYDFIDQFSSS